MCLEERVLKAQSDENEREDMIKEYRHFISSCSYKTLGHYISAQDDEFSIAVIAFNDAVNKYDISKGKFLNFATVIIRNRLIDYMRKEVKSTVAIPFSSLSGTDYNGEPYEFDAADTRPVINDTKFEIEALTEELRLHGITFTELTKVSPKSKKTKAACAKIIRFLLSDPVMVENIRTLDLIPVQQIMKQLLLSRKIAERHRKYIITAILVLSGDYQIIAEYFKNEKGGL